MLLKAHVGSRCLVLNKPMNLPEGGAEVRVEPVDGNDLNDHERARLHAALAESEDDVAAGRVRPAADVLADLNQHR